VVGLVPGLGEVADGTNAVISVFRGDWTGAGLSASAAGLILREQFALGPRSLRVGPHEAVWMDETIGLTEQERRVWTTPMVSPNWSDA